MDDFDLRPMTSTDRGELAELICISLNAYYETHGRPRPFSRGLATSELMFDVYEKLDPGCGVVAVSRRSGRLAGSCFYHPRPTHVSLGILNVHPNHFGCGVARALVQYVIDYADGMGQDGQAATGSPQRPVRLVSSALNLDSFSVYTRMGFVPQVAFQDLLLTVPAEGLPFHTAGDAQVRPATMADVPAMAWLEEELVGISRQQDYQYFLENHENIWHVSVYADDSGGLAGFLASVNDPGFRMLGPGLASTPEQAAALLLAELNRCCDQTVLFLVPAQCTPLVQQMYQWGARNLEIHFSQVRGPCQPVRGIQMPSFLPESG